MDGHGLVDVHGNEVVIAILRARYLGGVELRGLRCQTLDSGDVLPPLGFRQGAPTNC